jgi:alkylated DNA nucleotide flippase Atl1
MGKDAALRRSVGAARRPCLQLRMKPKKSWREKLATSKDLPKTMVIPAPLEVDALMKQVPRGRVVTINELRAALAAKHQVTFACPLTTGIFSWIAAHAAAEAEAEGAKRITPFWRTLKTGGEINPKYPGGVEAVAKRLRAEGHKVVAKGKRMLVADYEKKIFTKLA